MAMAQDATSLRRRQDLARGPRGEGIASCEAGHVASEVGSELATSILAEREAHQRLRAARAHLAAIVRDAVTAGALYDDLARLSIRTTMGRSATLAERRREIDRLRHEKRGVVGPVSVLPISAEVFRICTLSKYDLLKIPGFLVYSRCRADLEHQDHRPPALEPRNPVRQGPTRAQLGKDRRMNSTVGLHSFCRTAFALAGAILFAGLSACGGLGERSGGGVSIDAPVVPVWPADVTFKSCDQYAGMTVGPYYIQSNYWNLDNCPGTQCIEINTSTGAFSVTQGGAPCQNGESVSAFPNVLYGCSYGNCSPGTVFPMQVGAVSSLTSSWDFEAGGTNTSDGWNMAIELWFCPDNTCGANGFPNGFELMLWLDYNNARGYKDHLGTAKLAGYTWDLWYKEMVAGGKTVGWGYMD